LMDLGGKPAGLNTEFINAVAFGTRALEACGVKEVISNGKLGGDGTAAFGVLTTYQMEHPSPRAEFYAMDSVMYLDDRAIHQNLRDAGFDVQRWLMLPVDRVPNGSIARGSAMGDAEVAYHRDSSDEMTIGVKTPQAGYLRVLESWDPGWHATVNGSPAEVIPADDVFMAVAVGAGESTVHLEYSTPGMAMGVWMSMASLVGLLVVAGLGKWGLVAGG
jgi:hypothetical protein